MRLVFAAAIAFFAASAALAARDLVDCSELNSSHASEREHRDLGSGVVSYHIVSFGYDIGGRRLLIEGCATGDVLSVEYWHSEYDAKTGERNVLRNAIDATNAVLENAVNSSEILTFAMLNQKFSAAGAKVNLYNSDRESCACSRAHPDLRGSRQQFEWYQ